MKYRKVVDVYEDGLTDSMMFVVVPDERTKERYPGLVTSAVPVSRADIPDDAWSPREIAEKVGGDGWSGDPSVPGVRPRGEDGVELTQALTLRRSRNDVVTELYPDEFEAMARLRDLLEDKEERDSLRAWELTPVGMWQDGEALHKSEDMAYVLSCPGGKALLLAKGMGAARVADDPMSILSDRYPEIAAAMEGTALSGRLTGLPWKLATPPTDDPGECLETACAAIADRPSKVTLKRRIVKQGGGTAWAVSITTAARALGLGPGDTCRVTVERIDDEEGMSCDERTEAHRIVPGDGRSSDRDSTGSAAVPRDAS